MRTLLPIAIGILLAVAVTLVAVLLWLGIAVDGGPVHRGILGWVFDYQTILAGVFVVLGASTAYAGVLRTTSLPEFDREMRVIVSRAKVFDEAVRIMMASADNLGAAHKLKADGIGSQLIRPLYIPNVPDWLRTREAETQILGKKVVEQISELVASLDDFNRFAIQALHEKFQAESPTGMPTGDMRMLPDGSITWTDDETAVDAYVRVSESIAKSSTALTKATRPKTSVPKRIVHTFRVAKHRLIGEATPSAGADGA